MYELKLHWWLWINEMLRSLVGRYLQQTTEVDKSLRTFGLHDMPLDLKRLVNLPLIVPWIISSIMECHKAAWPEPLPESGCAG